ncbi:hypothetical protein [Streptomyces tropicalis]|uniref:Uncharacterized protein n=1 Tax=Streptomyces tropicalis TaxID=3034234 RepID=A0ABT6A6P0_9ACTN|nr:hypothetical protein [Streptomyces tropicalis]MDF3300138.1 hypothetical protein [Streptomyces tropicalis]
MPGKMITVQTGTLVGLISGLGGAVIGAGVEGLDHRGQKLFRHLAVAQAEKATGAKAKRVLVTAA